MLKHVLAVSSLAIAAPVFAQSAETSTPTAAAPTPGASVAPQQGAATPATEPAPAAQTPDQVSAIVAAEFAAYDKDRNNMLDKTEFAAWMDALKAKAPPGGDKPGDVAWNDAAFAQADKDKSQWLTQAELTAFLGSSLKARG